MRKIKFEVHPRAEEFWPCFSKFDANQRSAFHSPRYWTDLNAGVVMLIAMLVAANMCLQGGEQIDVSRYVEPTASWLELKVTLNPATGMLVVYSPGYEKQQAQFTEAQSSALLPFAEPILCVKAIGGPFEFNIEVIPFDSLE